MVNIQKSDKELIDGILKGNIKLFEEIIKNHQRLVFSIVIRFANNYSDREDVCQEIFIKVYQNLNSFKFQSKLSTWIGKVAYNHCINYIQKNSKNINIDSLENWNSEIQNNSDENFTLNLENTFEKKETYGLVKALIDQLPNLYQTILNLFHTQELSYQEISEVLSLPEGTVKSYLFRSRKLLKEKLLSSYKEEELI